MPYLTFTEAFNKLNKKPFMQKEMALFIGISAPHVNRILKGLIVPEARIMFKMCQYCEIDMQRVMILMHGGKEY